jgi:protein-L-isoaspartate(D-aspartate) O-methyltransferase
VEDFSAQQERMVREQIERRGLTDTRLLQAFRSVPRHHFVPLEERPRAYHDGPLPIGGGQTISQPYIVALMTSLLHLDGSQRVLEIGAGSGYQAAILGQLAESVHSVERLPELAERAAALLQALGSGNVFIHVGDGSLGWPQAAPYHAILVTAAAPRVPDPLLEQLAPGGRLVLPVGGRGGQELQVWERTPRGLQMENNIPVAFVPLRGKEGWPEEDWQ